MFTTLSEHMRARSTALMLAVDSRIERIVGWWVVLAALAAVSRMLFTPHAFPIAGTPTVSSYLLLILAPAASTVMALRWFSAGHLQPQPSIRLARYGCWRGLTRAEAESHPLYGTSGVMVSLLIGIMLNVPVRSAEYLAATPPLPVILPHWLSALHVALTFDAVLFNSLYMIAFIAAVRRVPLFPRLLLAIWLADLVTQSGIAKLVTAAGPPHAVAVALNALLLGNVKKVLISMALWLPYLLLSTRVNVTYRRRIPA